MTPRTKERRNDDVVSIEVQRNEARLLLRAINDRAIMLKADHKEGRMTDVEYTERWLALLDVERKVERAVKA